MSSRDKAQEIIDAHNSSTLPLIMIMNHMKYGVKSLTTKEFYQVTYYSKDNPNNECDCPSYRYRTGVTENGYCKHLWSIETILKDGVKLLTLEECMNLENNLK